MPCPSPGMNPYLEQDDAWHSFHFIYTAEPDPPLRGDDATWARALVPAGARQPAAG